MQSAVLAPLLDEGAAPPLRLPTRRFTLAPLLDEGEAPPVQWVVPWTPEPVDPPSGPVAPGTVLPEVTFELVTTAGSHVAWLSHVRGGGTFDRPHDGPGSVLVSVQRTDPVLNDVAWDKRIRVWRRGQVVQTGLIEPRVDRTVDQAEEAGQYVTLGGRGVLASLDYGTVDPISLDLKPAQDSVRFSFAHPDYNDAGWIAPKVIRYLDEAYASGATTPGPHWALKLDEWWDIQARVIAPHQGDVYNAPVGKWYLRKWFHLDEAATVQFDFASDGPATVFLNGQVLKTTGMPEQGLTTIHTVTEDLSAGWHLLAAEVTNRIWRFTTANPTGFLLTGMIGDPYDGNVVVRTDATWKMLAYPQVTPGWTAGKIIRWILNRFLARAGGKAGTITTSFNDTVDSAGRTWPLIPDETVQCSRSPFAAIMQLAELHIDVQMAPSGQTLHAWVKGTRGKVRATALTNTGPNPCLTRLQHRTEPPLASRLLVRWEEGWIEREVSRPWYREQALELPATLTLEQAERTADELLAVFSEERVEFSASVHPRTTAQMPFTTIQEGDWVQLPDRHGQLQSVRVLSIGATVDEDGRVSYELEAGDRVRFEDERLKAWLERQAPGFIGGRTEVAQPSRRDRGISKERAPVTEAEGFEIAGLLSDVGDPVSNVLRPTARWCFVRWVADLRTPGSSSTVVDILVNEVPVGSVVVPAGARHVTHTTLVYAGPDDRVQMELVSAGSGARGLVVKPIYRVG